jgi:hypothetical protein
MRSSKVDKPSKVYVVTHKTSSGSVGNNSGGKVRALCMLCTYTNINLQNSASSNHCSASIKEINNHFNHGLLFLFRSVGQIKICGCPNEERCQVNEEPCEEGQKGKERKEINLSLYSSSVSILILIQSQMLINDFAEENEQFLFFVYILHRSLDCELS